MRDRDIAKWGSKGPFRPELVGRQGGRVLASVRGRPAREWLLGTAQKARLCCLCSSTINEGGKCWREASNAQSGPYRAARVCTSCWEEPMKIDWKKAAKAYRSTELTWRRVFKVSCGETEALQARIAACEAVPGQHVSTPTLRPLVVRPPAWSVACARSAVCHVSPSQPMTK